MRPAGSGAPSDYLATVREAAPNDTVRALVTELAVEAIFAKTVDEAYAGDQLVTVRLPFAAGSGACDSGTGAAGPPLSVPYTMSGTAGARSEGSGTAHQCGVRHITATRGVR
ncbi:hypothetical protein [Streptomyces sp. MS191]|uniref:hypothetical protein n=1 Tax=Streptomyces sp. ms191 TaxID=1827978 RepID=UPI0011CE76FA|nr:hypothetical protein [Streptomyces sp. ms191]